MHLNCKMVITSLVLELQCDQKIRPPPPPPPVILGECAKFKLGNLNKKLEAQYHIILLKMAITLFILGPYMRVCIHGVHKVVKTVASKKNLFNQ